MLYRNIVVGTDGSCTARCAVRHAAALAAAAGAVLHVVYARQSELVAVAAPEMAIGAVDFGALGDAAARAILDEAAHEAELAGAAIETHGPVGTAAQCLLDVVREVGADLLVVGNQGMRGARRVFGSVPNTVSHKAPCHVLVVQTS